MALCSQSQYRPEGGSNSNRWSTPKSIAPLASCSTSSVQLYGLSRRTRGVRFLPAFPVARGLTEPAVEDVALEKSGPCSVHVWWEHQPDGDVASLADGKRSIRVKRTPSVLRQLCCAEHRRVQVALDLAETLLFRRPIRNRQPDRADW